MTMTKIFSLKELGHRHYAYILLLCCCKRLVKVGCVIALLINCGLYLPQVSLTVLYSYCPRCAKI